MKALCFGVIERGCDGATAVGGVRSSRTEETSLGDFGGGGVIDCSSVKMWVDEVTV